jgi:hypothetical protein
MTSFRRSFGVEGKEKQPDEERRAARFLYLYTFYFIRWSITTMPTIFRREVVDEVVVSWIFWRRGA